MQKNKKTLERLLTDLRAHLDDLDTTYTECPLCNRKTFTSRGESLLAQDVKKLIARIENTLKYMENNNGSNDETDDD